MVAPGAGVLVFFGVFITMPPPPPPPERGQVFGLTAPLITTSDGKKMGKSAAGAVWLNADRLPAYDYWQFWRNTADADVERFLKLFTELPLERCAELGALPGAEINAAKVTLRKQNTLHFRPTCRATFMLLAIRQVAVAPAPAPAPALT